jgi:hypothetical protein
MIICVVLEQSFHVLVLSEQNAAPTSFGVWGERKGLDVCRRFTAVSSLTVDRTGCSPSDSVLGSWSGSGLQLFSLLLPVWLLHVVHLHYSKMESRTGKSHQASYPVKHFWSAMLGKD